MKSLFIFAALFVMAGFASVSQAVIVQNGDFQADSIPAASGAENAQSFATDWVISGSPNAQGALYDPNGSLRFPSDPAYDGHNDNAVVLYAANAFVQQLLTGTTLANNKIYTLTVDVGNDAVGGDFPTVTNGVTGDARARLLVNGAASAMPGFLSSAVPVPADGDFTTWTLVWKTGASEPLAGDDITIDLSKGVTGGNFWVDNVSLTITDVAAPEPASLALLGAGAFLMVRRGKRLRVA